MILSTNSELGEYDLVREPEHIAKVWEAIKGSLSKYWQGFIESESGIETLAPLAAKFGAKLPTISKSEVKLLGRVFEKAVASYEKDAVKYRRFFDPDALEEFQDDPNSFKQALSRDVPVIANTLRQKRAELKEWQMHFRRAKAKDLLEVFANVIDFFHDWSPKHTKSSYDQLDEPSAFELDPLDNDETMYMTNVIGMGIKSILLYHIDPERLPARGRNGLYGLYFLSGRDSFELPSDSSEFLMVNDISPVSDGSLIMDQNYWYPYGLFSLYALRIYQWIDSHAKSIGYTLDQTVRYIYVERFLQAVCDQHKEDLKTMRAHERFEVPI